MARKSWKSTWHCNNIICNVLLLLLALKTPIAKTMPTEIETTAINPTNDNNNETKFAATISSTSSLASTLTSSASSASSSSSSSRQFEFICLFLPCPGDLTSTTTSTATSSAPPLTPPTDCTQCTCGTINTFHRIVGGQETEIHRYPWMATLNYKRRFYCGASLINDRYVITAGHCLADFDERDMSKITVRLMEHNFTDTDGNVHIIERQVSWFEVHKFYNGYSYDSDIALIRLNQTVNMTELTHPICMPSTERDFAGETGIATGWGAVCEGCHIAQTLREVRVPILSLEECRRSKYGTKRITENMLCAGVPEGGKDSCQGDSGGPLHIIANNTERHQLAGIVSWGWGCARPDYPGVYTRVNRFNDWVEERTRDACKCTEQEATMQEIVQETVTEVVQETMTEVIQETITEVIQETVTEVIQEMTEEAKPKLIGVDILKK